jgi:hypothetical protein
MKMFLKYQHLLIIFIFLPTVRSAAQDGIGVALKERNQFAYDSLKYKLILDSMLVVESEINNRIHNLQIPDSLSSRTGLGLKFTLFTWFEVSNYIILYNI